MRLIWGNSENTGVRAETNGRSQAYTREVRLGEEPRIKQTKQGWLAAQVSRLQKAPSTKHAAFYSKPKWQSMDFSQSNRTNEKLSADTHNVCLFNQEAKPTRSPALWKYQQQVLQSAWSVLGLYQEVQLSALLSDGMCAEQPVTLLPTFFFFIPQHKDARGFGGSPGKPQLPTVPKEQRGAHPGDFWRHTDVQPGSESQALDVQLLQDSEKLPRGTSLQQSGKPQQNPLVMQPGSR